MARAITSDDLVLETGGLTLTVSSLEPGDVLPGPHRAGAAHLAQAPRISFGYSVVDGPRLEQLGGAVGWLSDDRGRRIRVRLERIDPELKVCVAQVDPATLQVEPALPARNDTGS